MNASLRLLYLAALPATFALAVCSPVSPRFVSTSSTSSSGTGGAGVGGGAGGFAPGGAGGAGGTSGTGGSCPMGETLCGSTCTALTTDTDCGACGRTCGAGSMCSSGYCTPLTVCTNLGSNGSMTLFGGNAYSAAGQMVEMCPLGADGGASTDLWSTKALSVAVSTVLSDTQHVYFVTRDSLFQTPVYELYQSSGMAGNDTSVDYTYSSPYVATLDDPQTGTVFAVEQNNVYVVEISEAGDAGVPSRTCLSTTVTTANITNATAGGGKLFVASTAANTIVGTTVTGTACSTVTTLASGLDGPGALATDGSTVAFADANGIYACNAGLGCIPEASPTPLVTGQGPVTGIVLDTATPPNLYWIGTSGLVTCSSDASQCKGKPTVLIPNATPTSALAVDATYVYYVQGNVLNCVAK
jgi:hypothetical protein